MTWWQYLIRFRRVPHQDDLERASCDRAGEAGHWSCGVCKDHNKPRFICGCLLVTRGQVLERGTSQEE